MKLALFEVEPWQVRQLEALLSGFEYRWTGEPLDTGNVTAYGNAEIITVGRRSRLTLPVLVQLPRLALIVTRGCGCGHVDLAFCAGARIAVAELPVRSNEDAADQASALLAAVARRYAGTRKQPPSNIR